MGDEARRVGGEAPVVDPELAPEAVDDEEAPAEPARDESRPPLGAPH